MDEMVANIENKVMQCHQSMTLVTVTVTNIAWETKCTNVYTEDVDSVVRNSVLTQWCWLC